jgi:alpha-D-ribose 1-methylphosphonate 5-triphosphate synthase subunit PhnH
VPTRNWHAQANQSMMSLGTRLYPAHAATLLMALDSLTQDAPNNMPAGEWRVRLPN